MKQCIGWLLFLLCLAGCGETERPVQSTEQFRQSLRDIEKQQPHAGKLQQRAR